MMGFQPISLASGVESLFKVTGQVHPAYVLSVTK